MTIAGFNARTVALPVEASGKLVAERDAVGCEPVVGESDVAGEIGRAKMARSVAAGHESIAAAGAKIRSQSPIGAGAGERKAQDRVRRVAIIGADREAVVACGDVA